MPFQSFKTHTNNNAKIAVYGGMTILFVSVVVPLFLTPKEDFRWHWSFLLVGLFVGFFVYVIVVSFLKFFIRFKITNEGLKITRPFFHKRLIPYRDIVEVKLLDENETYEFFLQEVRGQYGMKDDGDLSTFFYKLRKESSYYKYLTITPRGTSSGEGQAEQLRSLHIKAEMLVLKLSDGKLLFLAPQHINEFYELLNNRLVKSEKL